MSTTPTANYGFSKIAPATEKDVWGPIQSTTLDGIDTQIKNRQNEAAAKMPLAGGTFTGKVTYPTGGSGAAPINLPQGVAPSSPVNGDIWSTSAALFIRLNTTTFQIATTVDVATKANAAHTHIIADVTGLQTALDGKSATDHTHVMANITDLAAALALKAALASPPLTGTPTAPTATPGTNTTQLATTAFVTAAVAAATSGPGAFNRQTASYTLVAGDVGKVIEMNVAGANNLTIPPNASVAIAVNSEIHGTQYGAGQTTVVAGSGVTLRASGGKLKSTAQYSGWTMKKVATDEWYVWGDLAA